MNFNLTLGTSAILAVLNSEGRECVNAPVSAIVPVAQEKAPVDKGALEAGIYAIKEGDDQNAAIAEARKNALAANPKAELTEGMALEDFSADGFHQAGVGVLAAYALPVHNGYGSHSGRPFLEEAAPVGEQMFAQKLNELGHKLSS